MDERIVRKIVDGVLKVNSIHQNRRTNLVAEVSITPSYVCVTVNEITFGDKKEFRFIAKITGNADAVFKEFESYVIQAEKDQEEAEKKITKEQKKSLNKIREELDFGFGLVFTDEDWKTTTEIFMKEYGNAKV